MTNPWRQIYDRIGEAAALEQLAEECAELGHAALKTARIIRGENPARTSLDDACEQLSGEIADVLNALNVFETSVDDKHLYDKRLAGLMAIKMNRWYDSLFDRDCEHCKHKVNGECQVWDCRFEPKEDK